CRANSPAGRPARSMTGPGPAQWPRVDSFSWVLRCYCALVAVTTATEVGVATPSMAAGAGGAGGGALPPGGGVLDEPPPPHADATTTKAMSSIAAKTSRTWRGDRRTVGI